MSKTQKTKGDTTQQQQPAKKAKYELPSLDEQQQLQNVEGVLHHSFFNLQIKEVIEEVKPAVYESKVTEDFIDAFVEHLGAEVRGLKAATINEDWLSSQGIQGVKLVNYSDEPTSFEMIAPVAIERIGSYISKTITDPFVNIDLAVHIPNDIFEERDLLNFVYFDKKALYLGAIAACVRAFANTYANGVMDASKSTKKSKKGKSVAIENSSEVFVTYFKGDFKKPMIIFRPKQSSSKKLRGLEIRVIPIISSSVFRCVQLNSIKNNVRPLEWLNKIKQNKKKGIQSSDQNELDTSMLTPTPEYNASVADDMSVLLHRRIIQETCSSASVANEVIVLFKVWLAQRDLRFGLEGFDSHCAALFVSYLLQTKRISSIMTVSGAFHVLLKFICEYHGKSCILNFSKVDVVVHPPSEPGTMQSERISLIHPVGTRDKFIEHDVFWRVTESTFRCLKAEARKSLTLLETCDHNNNDINFRRLFLASSSITDREDLIFQFNMSSNAEIEFHGKSVDALNWKFVSSVAYELLHRGYSDRVTSLSVQAKATTNDSSKEVSMTDSYLKPWLLHEKKTSTSSKDDTDITVTIGVTLHTEHAYRKVDRGPADATKRNHEEELEQFRNFWGERCELRRFQDGVIIDAVVWDANKFDNKVSLPSANAYNRGTLILGEITRYIMGRYFPSVCGQAGEGVTSPSLAMEWSDELKRLSEEATEAQESGGLITAKTFDVMKQCRFAIESLDSLRNVLVNRFEGLPLAIDEITAVDPELRYTSLTIPVAHPVVEAGLEHSKATSKAIQGKKVSVLVKPLLLLGRLESSGKWPSEADAVRKLKVAILIKLAEVLHDKHKVASVLGECTLDIFYNGLIFRLVLMSDKDIASAKNSASFHNNGLWLDVYNYCRMLRISSHHQHIRSVVSVFPCFPDTVRSFTRWLQGHYLTGILSVEAIELLVASVFLDYYPKSSAPSTAIAAFLQVLKRLHTFDFSSNPMLVDFDQSFTSADRETIKGTFDQTKASSSSHPLIYMVASYDRERNFAPLLWEHSVSKVEVNMLVQCSKASYELLTKRFESSTKNVSASSIISIDDLDSVNLVVNRSNLTLHFSHETCRLQTTITGDVPSYAAVQTFKNSLNSNLTFRNLTVRHSYNTLFHIQEGVVARLREQFGDIALFLWNANSGDKIFVIWKPAAFMPRNFSIMDTRFRSFLPTNVSDDSNALTIPNTTEIIAQILATSAGYVSKFELN